MSKKNRSSHNLNVFIKITAIIITTIVLLLVFRFFLIGKCGKSNFDNGWSCYFSSRGTLPVITQLHTQKCIKEGGKPKSGYQKESVSFYFSCIKEYPDTGKSCRNSSDCLGSCVYEKDLSTLPKGCKLEIPKKYTCSNINGTCSPIKKGVCDFWNEVNADKVIVHDTLCAI